MSKFAHISDCHLGAWKPQPLQEMEIKAFDEVIDICLKEKVDFIVISGDFFHSNIPDLNVVVSVTNRLKRVQDAGIPIYIVYGSHDYSPNNSSIIDILTEAGLFIKVDKRRKENGKIRLDFVTDPKTGAKIAGMSGRQMGIERRDYQMLDRGLLEREDGFKIFVFHAGLDELSPKAIAEIDSMSARLLPKGFGYYAGGHVHKSAIEDLPNLGKVCYAGPSFTGYSRDLEASAKGEERGFLLIEFDDKVTSVKFVKVDPVPYLYFEYDAQGKDSGRAQEELASKVGKLQVKGKIVVMKIKGELSNGKTSDMNLPDLRSSLDSKGAIFVHINRSELSSKEYPTVLSEGRDPQQIESDILDDRIDTVNVSTAALKGKKGAELARSLLSVLRQDKKNNEKGPDYQRRILDDCISILKLKEYI